MKNYSNEEGNVIFFIMLGVALLGLVTAAIRNSGIQGANIDQETLVLEASRVRQYTNELERGIAFIMQNGGISEVDIRFAHGDAHLDYGNITDTPERQLFHRNGGGAEYRLPPNSINDGSPWEFYGNTALPEVGSDRAELIAVLPNVTRDFCDYINNMIGYDAQPTDSGTCINTGAAARFDNGTQFDDGSPNTVDEATFSVRPSMQGCVQCAGGASDIHFYHVLMAR